MSKPLMHLASALLFALSFLSLPAEAKPPALGLDPNVALGAYKGMVEEHFAGIVRTTRALALTKEAKSGKWKSIEPVLRNFSKDLPTDATVWYAMPDGSYYSTESGGLTSQNLKDRAYFPKLLANKDVECDLVISKSTGHRSVIVASPVTRDGKVVAAIGVSVRVHLLSDLVSEDIVLPDGTYFYALDPTAKIVLHRYIGRIFKNVDDVADESLGDEFRKIMTSNQGTFEYRLNGKKIIAIFLKSKPLGWYFFFAQEIK
ncbi:MAG: cache domain-containing protein [Chlorobium sp.]|uniref:cache domain-containing protein n=1 Tax=Chlorobium sp. TaxID=1095 RepID=UPI002F3F71C0